MQWVYLCLAAVFVVGGMLVGMAYVFIKHLDRKDRMFADMVTRSEHTCHTFQRDLNDSTREAFKEVIRRLGETSDALVNSTEATVRMMEFLAHTDAAKGPDAKNETGQKQS